MMNTIRTGVILATVIGALLGASGSTVSSLRAEEVKRPLIFLWPGGAPGARGQLPADKPSITVYRPVGEKANGAAVLVCPGGGYGHLAVGHEGRDVGLWLNSLGVTALVLRYRIAPRYGHPAPLQDAQRALRTIRARAGEWKVDPRRIGILGFSAGGHLASTASTHFDGGDRRADDPVERVSCRPDFTILVYPVISLVAPFTHRGSRNNLMGPDAPPRLLEKFSSERQVTPRTPPAFLVHTSGDRGVPAENSIAFYMALRKANVAAELHIYEKGRHGFGLAPGDPVLSSWPRRCEGWLRARDLLERR